MPRALVLIAALLLLGPADVGGQWWRWGRPKRIPAASGDLASKPLFQWSDMGTFEGARGPNDALGTPGWKYAGDSIAFYQDPTHGETLFIGVGPVAEYGLGQERVMQIKAPATWTTTSTISAMTRFTSVQGSADPFDGTEAEIIGPSGMSTSRIRNHGIYVHNGRLIMTLHEWYDANCNQRVSHSARSLDLSATGTFAGWMALWDETRARFTAGAMLDVPDYAEAALGGPVISTGVSGSIVSCLSNGASAFAFNPDHITGRTPFTMAGTPLMYFTQANEQVPGSAANPDVPPSNAVDPNPIWNRATVIRGGFIPYGFRTLVLVGRHGNSDYCYGEGTPLLADHLTARPGGGVYCYSPTGGSSPGEYAEPYAYYYWLYDLSHLAEVAAGSRNYYNVLPYDQGPVTFPYMPAASHMPVINGVGYDPANRRVYLSQFRVDSINSFTPVIWRSTHAAAP